MTAIVVERPTGAAAREWLRRAGYRPATCPLTGIPAGRRDGAPCPHCGDARVFAVLWTHGERWLPDRVLRECVPCGWAALDWEVAR